MNPKDIVGYAKLINVMIDTETLKAQIYSAFADTPFPGQGNITNSYQSDESASIDIPDVWTRIEKLSPGQSSEKRAGVERVTASTFSPYS